MNKLTIYSDGSCIGNDSKLIESPGGYCAVILQNDKLLYNVSGSEENTTNNRMELKSIIEGIKSIKSPSRITVYSDSRYCIDGCSKWLKKWVKNNFRNGKIKNIDLWLELIEVSSDHSFKWRWVKGHSNNYWNNYCDSIAKEQAYSLISSS